MSKIFDFDGNEIAVGTRVHMEADASATGTVTDISEWEGDVDDEGRSIGIPPYVGVEFDDGSTDSFITSEWEYEGWAWDREPVAGKVEDLTVVTQAKP